MIHHYAPVLFYGGTPLRNALQLVLDLGGLGVDLFFALSGFLITGILYDSKGKENFFRRFYWRRSLRIFPAYFAFLLPFLVFVPRLFEHLSRWWFLLYLRNWAGPDIASDKSLGHLWSLAVEEQFYIFWAVAVYLCTRRKLPWLIAGLSVSALLFRGWMIAAGFPRYDQIRFTPARIDALLLGGLVAVAWRSFDWAIFRRVASWCLFVSAVAFISILLWRGNLEPFFSELVSPSLTAVFFASLVAVSLISDSAFLLSPILRNIAKYSYAMYLWHLLPFVFGLRMLHFAERHSPLVLTGVKLVYLPLLFSLTYALARVSWVLVEEPCLRWKDRYFA